MTTRKTSVSFRISDQALEHLESITRATGATKTATVETALALMAEKFRGENKMKHTYQYIEDNGGGLHLFVLDEDNQVVLGITNLEHAQAGEWHEVKDSLKSAAYAEASQWSGQMQDHDIDPTAAYQEFINDEHSSKVVAQDGMVYPDRMGVAAQKYFSQRSIEMKKFETLLGEECVFEIID